MLSFPEMLAFPNENPKSFFAILDKKLQNNKIAKLFK